MDIQFLIIIFINAAKVVKKWLIKIPLAYK